jgi:hypothetical protein
MLCTCYLLRHPIYYPCIHNPSELVAHLLQVYPNERDLDVRSMFLARSNDRLSRCRSKPAYVVPSGYLSVSGTESDNKRFRLHGSIIIVHHSTTRHVPVKCTLLHAGRQMEVHSTRKDENQLQGRSFMIEKKKKKIEAEFGVNLGIREVQ